MVSDFVRVSLTLLVVSGVSVGAAIAMTDFVGPVEREDDVPQGDSSVTLVGYPLLTREYATENRTMGGGQVAFDPLPVDLTNVTSVSVTFRIKLEGPTVTDTYTIYVTAPDGVEKSGTHEASTPNPNGYDQTVPVIQSWPRTPQPRTEPYETSDHQEALRRSSQNHTDLKSLGEWRILVEMTPPAAPLRSATASLLFSFTYYEGIAFPADDTQPAPNGSPAPLWGSAVEPPLADVSRPYPIRS